MAWLAGSNNFKLKNTHGRVERESSSEEYEESDEETAQIFQVRKIVKHIKLNKGQVYKQARGLTHTFDINAMEDSKMGYAFRVRWRGFGEEEDTWEPIENFNRAMSKKIRKYCKRKNIPIPEGFEEWLMPNSSSEENTSGSEVSDAEGNDRRSATPKRRPSPSPQRPPKDGNKKPFDPLFDLSEDEKEEEVREKKAKNGTPLQEKKKKAQKEDAEEARKKKEKKDKEMTDELAELLSDAKEGGGRKKKERAELEKQAAEHIKKLVEEEKLKKEKKQGKIDKEKRKSDESEKGKRKSDESDKQKKIRFNHSETMDHDVIDLTDSPSPPQKKPHRDATAVVGTSESSSIESQKELEMKNRKRKLEEKKDEDNKKNDNKKELKKGGINDAIKKTNPTATSFRIPKKKEGADAEEMVANIWGLIRKKAPSAPSDPEKTKGRMSVVDRRTANFVDIGRAEEFLKIEKWREEEEKWRKKMYEQKKWKKNKMIKDVPFNFRVEERETDRRRYRTLRRCSSVECLPNSFRRLSSLHSMDTMESEADSLIAALIDCRIGEQVEHYRNLRVRTAVRKAIEGKANKDEKVVPDSLHIKEKTELFIRETIAMADELMPGAATEEIIRDMSMKAIGAFFSLSFESFVPIFQAIYVSECINRTILRLISSFSSVVNLVEATDGHIICCDEGEHRKCRMLLTLLMTLSEPHRMGEGEECILPPNSLYDSIGFSAPCQIRTMIRGGCTFDGYYDAEGKNAAHVMMEKFSMKKLIWLIERGLDVNSVILPQKESDLANELYDRPWKLVKESNETMAFVSQLHSQRLTARSVMWTKHVQGVGDFSIRPLTLVHTLNSHAYFHRFAAVTLCDEERRGFDIDDAVLLAVHAVIVRHGKGLRATVRKTKKCGPSLSVPYFLIDRAADDATFEHVEKYECTKARLTIHNLDRPSTSDTIELTRLGSNGATTVFRVPKKQAQSLVSGRRFTECLLKLISPPEHSVILAQYFIVPYKSATGRCTE